jgi:acetyl-CoA carboxylase alpha subunit
MAHTRDEILAALFDGPTECWDGPTPATGPDGPLGFPGYDDARAAAAARSDADEAVTTGEGEIGGHHVAYVVGVFAYMGGSMSTAVGARVADAFDRARARRLPVVTVIASGGARMHEGMAALVQMPRTIVASAAHGDAGLLHVVCASDPTTGGMWASFASLGDVVIAEDAATVAFAGPRVAAAALGRPLAEGTGTAEGAYAAGLVDAVAPLSRWRERIAVLLDSIDARPEALDDTVAAPHPPVDPAADPGADPGAGAGAGADVWTLVAAARDPDRPSGAAFVDRLLTDVTELHGDRSGGVDPTVRTVVGRLHGRPVVVVAQDRHSGDGRPRPAGYRAAVRALTLAARLHLPVITLVDTPGAAVDEGAEHGGIAQAIAATMRAVLTVPTPVLSVCVGEGGSGGALALAVGDRLWMQRSAIFSVIAPESAAVILHRDAARAPEVARQLKLTATELVRLGVADGVVSDAVDDVGTALARGIDDLAGSDPAALVQARRARWRAAVLP